MEKTLQYHPTKAPLMRLTLLLTLLATSAFAAPAVYNCNDGDHGTTLQSPGASTMVTTGNANAVTTTVVPAAANRVVISANAAIAVCERVGRCNAYSATAVSSSYLLITAPTKLELPTGGGVISLTSAVTGTLIGLQYCKQQ